MKNFIIATTEHSTKDKVLCNGRDYMLKVDPGARCTHIYISSHPLIEFYSNLGGLYHYPGFIDEAIDAERGVLLKVNSLLELRPFSNRPSAFHHTGHA